MIRAFGGKHGKLMVREGEGPIFSGENPVKSLQRWSIPLIRPGVKPPLEKKLLELSILDELPEQVHHASVQARVIFILRTIYQVKVAPNEPGASAIRSHLSEFVQESIFS